MLDRVKTASTDRIAALVRALLAKRSIVAPLLPDDDLTESGLSSLDMVNLMLAVEGEFGVTIPDRSMTPSNFRTIASIEALISSLRKDA